MFPPSLGVNSKGKGGEALAKDIQERARKRGDGRPPRKPWEKVTIGLLLVVSLLYLIVDKVIW